MLFCFRGFGHPTQLQDHYRIFSTFLLVLPLCFLPLLNLILFWRLELAPHILCWLAALRAVRFVVGMSYGTH